MPDDDADLAACAALAGIALTRERLEAMAPLARAMAVAGIALAGLGLTEAPSGPDETP